MTATPPLAVPPIASTPIGDVGQIGILVNDFDAALDLYGRMFGIEEWTCYHYTPEFLRWSRYGDAEGRFEMLLAMGGSSPQVELIQPLTGPSIYQDFLDEGHVGLHHLGVFVDDLDGAVARMAESGYRVTQTARGYGLNGDGGFAYFDTEKDLGAVIEAIEVPDVRRPGEVRRTAGATEPDPASPQTPRIDNPFGPRVWPSSAPPATRGRRRAARSTTCPGSGSTGGTTRSAPSTTRCSGYPRTNRFPPCPRSRTSPCSSAPQTA